MVVTAFNVLRIRLEDRGHGHDLAFGEVFHTTNNNGTETAAQTNDLVHSLGTGVVFTDIDLGESAHAVAQIFRNGNDN